jgi:zinc transport system substrate-binding protein
MRLPLILSASLLAMPALAEVPKVMTDLPAVHSLTAQVMGDLGTPGILLDRGSDPHHFQLKPSQARALSQADLVIWIGPEMTPWLARAIEGVGLPGEALELIELETTHRQNFGGAAADHEEHGEDEDHDAHEEHDAHEDHEEHAGEADHDDHDHDHDAHDHVHEGLDPHAWLTPENGQAWLTAIAAELSRLDPDNAATYAANAQAAKAALEETEAHIRTILAPVGDAPIVVFHDAYGYFATHFGVNVAGAIALGDAAAPGARRLAEIHETLEHAGAVCVFPEAQHDPAYVQTVVEGTGVRVGGVLDPSGSALDYGPGLYDALLTGLATTIADCVTAAK